MTTVNVHQAKTQLSRLMVRVEAGEEVGVSAGDRAAVDLGIRKRPKHDSE